MKSFSQKKITCATNDFSLFFQALATLFCPTTWVLRQGLVRWSFRPDIEVLHRRPTRCLTKVQPAVKFANKHHVPTYVALKKQK